MGRTTMHYYVSWWDKKTKRQMKLHLRSGNVNKC